MDIKFFIFNNKIINILAEHNIFFRFIFIILIIVFIIDLDNKFSSFAKMAIIFLNSLYYIFEKKYKEKKIKYRNIKQINEVIEINDIGVFPSGNIIYITNSNAKILNNNNYELVQMFGFLFSTSIDIKDENNFLITSK